MLVLLLLLSLLLLLPLLLVLLLPLLLLGLVPFAITVATVIMMIVIMLCSWCFYDIGLQSARFDRLNFLLLLFLALL